MRCIECVLTATPAEKRPKPTTVQSVPVRATRDPSTGHRRLWAVELWEISIVTFPMLAEARIAAGDGIQESQIDRSLQAAISLLKQ